MVTMEQIMINREERAKRQKEWLKRYGKPLVSFTLNIPGPIKQSSNYNRIHEEGLAIILNHITVVDYEKRILPTGSEAIISVEADTFTLKKYLVTLENNHSLGRLFDIDVLDVNGQKISRLDLNLPPRKCLLCQEDARICARSGAHRIEDLLREIERISKKFFG